MSTKLTRKQKDAFRIIWELADQNRLEERHYPELAGEVAKQDKAFNTVKETLSNLGMRI